MIPGLFQAAANGSGAPATSSAPSATDTTSQLSMMLPSQQQVHTHNIMVNITCIYMYMHDIVPYSGKHSRDFHRLAEVSIMLLENYHRNWLLSACAYNTWQQESIRLTGSMRLIKSAKTR